MYIRARTTKPDDSVIDFDDKVFEQSLLKSHTLRVLAKTFTLPGVGPGCIIEYSYTLDLQHAYASHWILSENLFTKKARFSLKPYTSTYMPVSLRWSWHDLPSGAEPKEGPDRVIRTEASNIGAFQMNSIEPASS